VLAGCSSSDERMLHKDYNLKCSVKENAGRDLKRLGAKTNRLAVDLLDS
jgi:hypothetical protein